KTRDSLAAPGLLVLLSTRSEGRFSKRPNRSVIVAARDTCALMPILPIRRTRASAKGTGHGTPIPPPAHREELKQSHRRIWNQSRRLSSGSPAHPPRRAGGSSLPLRYLRTAVGNRGAVPSGVGAPVRSCADGACPAFGAAAKGRIERVYLDG